MANNRSLRFIRLPNVEHRVGLRHTQIHKLEVQGKFPRRVKISARAAGWLESEIDAWIDSRIAASRGGDPSAPSAVAQVLPEDDLPPASGAM